MLLSAILGSSATPSVCAQGEGYTRHTKHTHKPSQQADWVLAIRHRCQATKKRFVETEGGGDSHFLRTFCTPHSASLGGKINTNNCTTETFAQNC